VRRRFHDAGFVLGAVFVLSACVRILIAIRRTTPLYYPDEYIYTSLARSISATGVPSLRGDAWHFPSFLAPYLMAPAWWISSVTVAYRIDLILGAVWFSAAVFPAYALARRVDLSTRGSLVVALFAVLVPDAAYAATALSEPYAYPIFLVTVLVSIDAIASPTVRRQRLVLCLMAALCLLRAQFVVMPLVYLGTAFIGSGGKSLRMLREQAVIAAPMVLAFVAILAFGPSHIAGFYSDYLSHSFKLPSAAGWFGLDLFVLLLAAGWAIAPGAVLGLLSLLRSPEPSRRVFGLLTVGMTGALLAEATYPAAIHHRPYERYVFYTVPLLAVGCVYAVEQRIVSRVYPVLAYALAIAAVVVPATDALRSAETGQSPSLLWLNTLGGGGSSLRLAWAIGLALSAVAVAQLRDRPYVGLLIGLVVVCFVGAAATRAVVRFAPLEFRLARNRPIEAFSIGAPKGAALVTWSGTDQFILMKTLFWSPAVNRVLVLGGGKASDGFAATTVHLADRHGVADARGRPVEGPFAFGVDATVAEPSAGSWFRRWPNAFILGLDRENRVLDETAQLVVETRTRPREVSMRLIADSPRRLTFSCPTGRVDANIGRTASWVRVRVPQDSAVRCRISLTRGAAVEGTAGLTSGVKVLRFTVA
jgi:hypothetical protein